MGLKKFFKPDRSKIIVTSAITIILAVLFLGILNLPTDCSDNPEHLECNILSSVGLLIPFWFVPFILGIMSLEYAGGNVILFYLLLIPSIILTILYWYLLSCILIFIFRKLKELFKKYGKSQKT